MTLIAAIETNNKVYMLADSAGVGNMTIATRTDPKIFKRKYGQEEMMFGFTTSFRMGQILQYSLRLPKQKKSETNQEYIYSTFISEIRQTFKDEGFCNSTHLDGGTFMFARKGKLYTIYDDFQVAEHPYGYHAIGCGYAHALGSLHTTATLKNMNPNTRLTLAAEATQEFCNGVRGPFTTMTL